MKIAIITGSAGLIGSESARFLSDKFDLLVGIDNNMRKYFFGQDGSVEWNIKRLKESIPNYRHIDSDIRNKESLSQIFEQYQAGHIRVRQSGRRLLFSGRKADHLSGDSRRIPFLPDL